MACKFQSLFARIFEKAALEDLFLLLPGFTNASVLSNFVLICYMCIHRHLQFTTAVFCKGEQKSSKETDSNPGWDFQGTIKNVDASLLPLTITVMK